MELDKIRNLSDDELKAEEAKAAEQLFRIRFAKSLGKQEGLKNLRIAEARHRPFQDRCTRTSDRGNQGR